MLPRSLTACLALALLLPPPAAGGASPRLPKDAMRAGVPALLDKDTAKQWLAWEGAAVLGFFHPTQKGMGLKALAADYKGKIPLGGVRHGDAEVQKMFNVADNDLPVILVLQRGTVSMRLGGGSNQATLRTLINSALMSAPPPPPPSAADVRKRTSAATVRTDCAQVTGPCLVLVGMGAAADKFSDMLGQDALRLDDPIDNLAVELGYQGSAPALYVIKGNSRPRVARYSGGGADRKAITKFFTDLKEGALSFAAFVWPTNTTKKPKAGGGGGGKGEGAAAPPPPRSKAELSSAQYANDVDEGEVIELQDDDE